MLNTTTFLARALANALHLWLTVVVLIPARAQQFVISTYAGGPLRTDAPANASIGAPQSVATDVHGNVYFTSANRVFKLDSNGVLTQIAGTGHAAYSGDGGPATGAALFLDDGESGWPNGLAIDSSGNVYIADRGNSRVRKISADGIISSVAGTGDCCLYSGEGGPATAARLGTPVGLALDSAGNLHIADQRNQRVFKVSAAGVITTFAGTGNGTSSGDGGPATSAGLAGPIGIAVDGANNLYIAGTNTVRKVSPSGIITTVAGNGVEAYSGDGGPAANAGLSAGAVAVDGSGNLYIGDTINHRVRKVSPGGIITTVAGTGANGYSGDSGPAGSAQLGAISGVAVDSAGNLFIADIWNLRIRQVSPSGVIATVAGNGSCCNYGGDGGPATAAQLNFFPWGGGMAADSGGNLFVADTGNLRVRRIASGGIITTIAGTGVTNSYSGDGGPAISQTLNYPSRVALDRYGNVYIADTGNLRVRKVSADGMISTVDTGAGRGVAVDSAGNLYVAIGANVTKISPTGAATTAVALGDDSLIFDLAIDRSDNLYLADIVNYRVFKASPEGVVTVVAGTGAAGDSGDGGPAANAKLNAPVALAIDRNDNLYIADTFNRRIRMVSPEGIITTVAGTGAAGYSGDGGPAVGAEFGLISGLTIDGAGNLYAADQTYNAIRMFQPAASSEEEGIGRHRR